MCLVLQPLKPLPNVIAFEPTIGRKISTADPVGASVRHEHAVTMLQEHLRVAGHAKTIVAKPMHKQNDFVVGVLRFEIPSTKRHFIGCPCVYALQMSTELPSNLLHLGFGAGGQETPLRIQSDVRKERGCGDTKKKVDAQTPHQG